MGYVYFICYKMGNVKIGKEIEKKILINFIFDGNFSLNIDWIIGFCEWINYDVFGIVLYYVYIYRYLIKKLRFLLLN